MSDLAQKITAIFEPYITGLQGQIDTTEREERQDWIQEKIEAEELRDQVLVAIAEHECKKCGYRESELV